VLNKSLQKEKTNILIWEEKILGFLKIYHCGRNFENTGLHRFSDVIEHGARRL
jgi:hypothetical protein